MKHNIILYIILLIVLIFLIIYKNKILEGLTYLPNLTKKDLSTGTLIKWKTYSQCNTLCPATTCSGFTSVPLNTNPNTTGTCITFPKNDPDLNITNLRNLTYDSDSYLYIK